MLDFLRGKKTYLVAAVVAVVSGAKAVVSLHPEWFPTLQASWLDAAMSWALGGGGLAVLAATLRAGMAKTETPQ